MPKKCSGCGLFCLARHLGRAISLPVAVSGHLLLASIGPSHVVGLEQGVCCDEGRLPHRLGRIPVPTVVHPYS